MCPEKSTVLALLVTIAMSVSACAQNPGGPGGSRGGMGREGSRPNASRGASAAEVPLSPGALVQTLLDRLEDDLKPGPAQRSAWNAYADKVQKLADDVERSRFEARTSSPGASSAPQQLDRIAADMRGHMAIVAEIVALGRALYETLTPEQKAIADRRLALPVALLATGIAPPGMIDGAKSDRMRRE